MRLFRFLLLLLFLIWKPVVAEGFEPLERFLDGLKTWEARFRQQTLYADSSQVSHEQGVFYLSRPNRFRWEYKGRYPRTIIADGQMIWMIEDDLQQVSQQFQKLALKGTPAAVLAEGELKLDDDFRLEELGRRGALVWLKLTPLDEHGRFQEIQLGFDGNELYRLEMVDQYGQMTRIDFSGVRRNPELDSSLFRFKPPPGYDILDQ